MWVNGAVTEAFGAAEQRRTMRASTSAPARTTRDGSTWTSSLPRATGRWEMRWRSRHPEPEGIDATKRKIVRRISAS
jgi:hypothetical protein